MNKMDDVEIMNILTKHENCYIFLTNFISSIVRLIDIREIKMCK